MTMTAMVDDLASLRDEAERLMEVADHHDGQLAEALDEVERLRAENERLQVEKHDLAERLMRAGSDPT